MVSKWIMMILHSLWVCRIFWGKSQIPKGMTSSGQIFYCKRYRAQHFWNSHSKLCQETESPLGGAEEMLSGPLWAVTMYEHPGSNHFWVHISILMAQQQTWKHLKIITPPTATSINYCYVSLIVKGKKPLSTKQYLEIIPLDIIGLFFRTTATYICDIYVIHHFYNFS